MKVLQARRTASKNKIGNFTPNKLESASTVSESKLSDCKSISEYFPQYLHEPNGKVQLSFTEKLLQIADAIEHETNIDQL